MQNPQGFTAMALFEDSSRLPAGISLYFYQPVTATRAVHRAVFRSTGDKVRIKVTWSRLMPGVKSFNLSLIGSFDGRHDDPFAGTPLKIDLKLPAVRLRLQPAAAIVCQLTDQLGFQPFGRVRLAASGRGLSRAWLTLTPDPKLWKGSWFEGREFLILPRLLSGTAWSEILVNTERLAEKLGASSTACPTISSSGPARTTTASTVSSAPARRASA